MFSLFALKWWDWTGKRTSPTAGGVPAETSGADYDMNIVYLTKTGHQRMDPALFDMPSTVWLFDQAR